MGAGSLAFYGEKMEERIGANFRIYPILKEKYNII